MDRILGSIIDDYTLFRIIQGIIIILILLSIYIGIQITLMWKFLKKEEVGKDEFISNRKSFYRIAVFIFIAGFFMLLHEFLEGFEEIAPDTTTYEFFELMALLGLFLFMYEWYRILRISKRKQKESGIKGEKISSLKVS